MVIGDPVEHSLSPQIHNAGYKALGIDNEYVFVGCRVQAADLENFKVDVMKYLDEIDDVAKKIGAVNTVVNDNGIVKGYNTDWLGVIVPLEKTTSLEGKTVAILGAGGGARAAAYAVTSKGATLSVYNRTIEKAQTLIKEFGGEAFSRDSLEQIKDADIIINTTTIGLHPHENETPIPMDFVTNKHIIFDLVYSAHGDTKLIEEAKKRGAQTISGIEMLLHQGFEQFKLFTGQDAPTDAMRKAIV